MKSIKCKDLINYYSTSIIIDLRDKDEYCKSHIPGSYNIPFEDLIDKLTYYLSKDKIYFLICKYGIRSKEAYCLLIKKGFKVINVCDGLVSWKGPLIS